MLYVDCQLYNISSLPFIIDIDSAGLDEIGSVKNILFISKHPTEAAITLKCRLTAADNLTLVPF
jgi:hypothetical protein